MFAHGPEDCREPVYDLAEVETGSCPNSNTGAVDSAERRVADHDKDDKCFAIDPKWNGNLVFIYTLYVYDRVNETLEHCRWYIIVNFVMTLSSVAHVYCG